MNGLSSDQIQEEEEVVDLKVNGAEEVSAQEVEEQAVEQPVIVQEVDHEVEECLKKEESVVESSGELQEVCG